MTERQLLAIAYGLVLGLANTTMATFVLPEDVACAACSVILSAVLATGIVAQLPRWQ